MNGEQARMSSSITTAGSALNAISEMLNCVICPPKFLGVNISGCLLVNTVTELASTHPAVRQFVDDAKASMLHLLKVLIAKAQEQGGIPATKNPAELALYLFSSMQGLKVTGMLVKTPKELLPIVGVILKTLTCA
jgi:TetR/AcrR family transcriptional repressor of nem operon